MAVIYMGCRDDQMVDGFSMDSMTQEPLTSLSEPNKPSVSSIPVPDSSRQTPNESDPGLPPAFTPDDAAPQNPAEPVIMTDYKNWTLIAENISSRNGYSIGTGKTGITHRDGMFITASEGFICHADQDGQIDSIYIPKEARIKLPNGLEVVSIGTELIQKPDGTYTMHSGNIASPETVDFYNTILATMEPGPQ